MIPFVSDVVIANANADCEQALPSDYVSNANKWVPLIYIQLHLKK